MKTIDERARREASQAALKAAQAWTRVLALEERMDALVASYEAIKHGFCPCGCPSMD